MCLTVLDNHNSLNRPEIKTIALSLTIITIHSSGTSDTTFSFFVLLSLQLYLPKSYRKDSVHGTKPLLKGLHHEATSRKDKLEKFVEHNRLFFYMSYSSQSYALLIVQSTLS